MAIPGVRGFLSKCGWYPVDFGAADDWVVDIAAPAMYEPADCEQPLVVDGTFYSASAEQADKAKWMEVDAPWDEGTQTLLIQDANANVRNGSSGPGVYVAFDTAPKIIMGGPIPETTAMAPQALVINITGTWTSEPVFTVLPQQGLQFDGVLYSPTGAWVGSFTPTDTGVTTLTLPNLAGVVGTFAPSLSAATSIDASALVVIGEGCSPVNMPLLATLDFSFLVIIGGSFSPTNLDVLLVLDNPVLTTVVNGYGPENLAALTDLLAPALTYVGGNFSPSSLPLVVTVDFTALVTIVGNFELNGLSVLPTFDVSSIVSIGQGENGIYPTNCSLLEGLNFSNLANVGGQITGDTLPAFTYYTFPAIVSIAGSIEIISNTEALDTFTLGSALKFVGGDVTFTSCALLEASVDNILVRLAALDGTGGTTSYDNHAVTITGTSAPPSAAGLTAKATLEGRGNTVTVN